MNDKVHSQAVRFSEDSLAGLDARTRSILSIDGLPTANPVFSAEPSGVEVTQAVPKAGDLVCLGESLNGDGAQIGLRIDAGTVVEYRPEFSDAIYVSESIEKFRDILKIFDTRSVYHMQEGNEEELDALLRISSEFRSKIAAIDSTALAEGDEFWGTILMEISNGDWSEEGPYLVVGPSPAGSSTLRDGSTAHPDA